MGFVQAQRVFNSSKCGCVFIQTDAVWWSECQYCSRLTMTVCYLSLLFPFFCYLFVPDCLVTECSTTFVCLRFCLLTVFIYASIHGNQEDSKYQESKFINESLVQLMYSACIYTYSICMYMYTVLTIQPTIRSWIFVGLITIIMILCSSGCSFMHIHVADLNADTLVMFRLIWLVCWLMGSECVPYDWAHELSLT